MHLLRFADELRQAPFVRLLLPFAIGIVAHRQANMLLQWPSATMLCLAVFMLLLVAKRRTRGAVQRSIYGACASALMLAAGVALAQNVRRDGELPLHTPICIAAVVSDEPSANARYAKLTVDVSRYRDSSGVWRSAGETMLLYLRIDTAHALPVLGDAIVANVKIAPHGEAKNPYEFEHNKYLNRHGIFASTFVNGGSCAVVAHNALPLWRAAPKKLRRHLLSYFAAQGIQGEELAVLQALTLGDKSMLDTDLRQSYAAAGAMHILAVSGLHVGIISMILGYCLKFMDKNRRKKRIKGTIILLCIWLYALLAGGSLSVVRASVMFSVLTIGGMMKRWTSTYNTLAFAAFITCAFDPQALTDAGFQLSYSAVLAILFFQPRIRRLLYFRTWLANAIWDLLVVSLAANIGTLPISVYLFHQMPLYFLLTNLLVTVPVTLVMAGFVLSVPFAFLPSIPLVGWLIAKGTEGCIVVLNFSVRWVESLPCSLLEGLWITPAQTWLLLLATLMLALCIWMRSAKMMMLCLALLIAFVGTREYRKLNLQTQKMMAVYCIRDVSFVALVDGTRAVAYCDSAALNQRFDFNLKSHCAKLGLANDMAFERHLLQTVFCDSANDVGVSRTIVRFGGKTLRVACNECPYKPRQALDVDYLVVSAQCRLRPQQLLEIYHPHLVIIDSSHSFYAARRLAQAFAALGCDVYNVNEQGAFVCTL